MTGVSPTTRTVPFLGDDGHEELSSAVGSLHSFVDLVERVQSSRALRLTIFALLNLADCATTIWFLRLGGTEANPLLAPIVHRWWAPLAVKLVVFVLVWRSVMGSHPRARHMDRLLVAALAYYVIVIAWNLVIVWQL